MQTESLPARQSESPAGRHRALLSPSFLGLLTTQLLTAINDNIFRWLAIGIGKDYVDASGVALILAAGTACFVLPYLLLAAYAGFLADRLSKPRVIVGCKIAEVIIMAAGLVAIRAGHIEWLFIVVALMGAQSALFSPAKLGAIPELLRPDRISEANGLFGLATVSATVIGMAVGNWLSVATGYRGQEHLWLSALVLLGVASVGLLLSLLIEYIPPANPRRAFPWNPFVCTFRDLRTLMSHRALHRVAWGIVFFWAIGSLAQLNIDQFAAEGGALQETDKVPFLVALVVGVGFGSVLAGIWSAGRVELGILPLGAFGVAICSMLLFFVQGAIIQPESIWHFSFVAACLLLFLLGSSAGLYSVPLESYLQYRSPSETRGTILAATNFLVFFGILCSAALYLGLRAPVYEGSLDHLPAELTGPTPPAAIAEQIDRSVAEFRRQWQEDEQPEIEPILAGLPKEVRAYALSRLLWEEFDQRRRSGEFVQRSAYLDRFSDYRPLVKAVYDQSTGLPLLTSQQIFLLAGIGTIPVLVYILWLIPQASIRFLVWLASRTIYRVRVFGRDHLPAVGGALLVCNHVSWIDGVLLLLTSSRPIRMIVWAGNFQHPLLRRLADLWGAILVGTRPKEILAALQTAREALQNGELVCIFPEGGITRSGQLMAFRPGLMKILDGTDAPVLPVYLDGLWGSIFSFERGRFFWKWPRRWPYPVYIHFGEPFPNPGDVYHVRRVVQEMGAEAVEQRMQESPSIVENVISVCRRRLWASKVADSTGADLTGGQLLTRMMITRRLLRRHVLDDDESYVGVLLPPSAGSLVINGALAIDGRIAVNLNYTGTSEIINHCLEQANIRHVLTSRRFMEKMDFQLDCDMVYLEDLRDRVTTGDKLVAAMQAYVVPASLLNRHLRLSRFRGDDLLTVIFTSGSTGEPKGVMLTHTNVTSNVEAVEQVIRIRSSDVLVGILPFFHSFGYTITMWTVLGINVKGVYHFNPLDARTVGKLCRQHGGTLLLATPTFLRAYVRRCEKEDFHALDTVVTGAEKLPVDVADSFEKKFGVRPVEGYGTTELSPLVSVNIPPARSSGEFQVERKEGTVGRPVPGVAAKVIDLGTGEELGANQSGMLLIKGPNVMKGYLGREELTAEVIRDGWYVTGDVARIDDDGFIEITGRESRFSKIGGEMVPHLKIEEVLSGLVGENEDGSPRVAVTAVPDEKKGERIIVMHTPMEQTPEELCKAMADAGLPNLYIPSPDSFIEIERIPILGTGKLDLKAVRQEALDRTGQKPPS